MSESDIWIETWRRSRNDMWVVREIERSKWSVVRGISLRKWEFFRRFIYLFESLSYKERRTERRESFILWFILKMTMMVWGLLDWNQKPEASSRPHMWIAQVQTLEPSSTALFKSLARNWIWSEASGTQTNALIGCWHCGWWRSVLCHNASPWLENFLMTK